MEPGNSRTTSSNTSACIAVNVHAAAFTFCCLTITADSTAEVTALPFDVLEFMSCLSCGFIHADRCRKAHCEIHSSQFFFSLCAPVYALLISIENICWFPRHFLQEGDWICMLGLPSHLHAHTHTCKLFQVCRLDISIILMLILILIELDLVYLLFFWCHLQYMCDFVHHILKAFL